MSLTASHPVWTPTAPLRKTQSQSIAWGELAALSALYAASPAIGAALLLALFHSGLLANVGVLFYRGLVLIGVAFAGTLALLVAALGRFGGRSLRRRDAFPAAILSLAFNLCFFVLVPVTVDRSISVFILGEMAAHEQRAYSSDEMSRLFADVYVGDYRQIDRRMREQLLSGNVAKVGDGYRISPRGVAFIRTSRLVAGLFGEDTRLISPLEPSQPRLRAPLRLATADRKGGV